MSTSEATLTPGQVIGDNLRRLREQRRLTQHEMARLLLAHGLKWSRSKIAAIEAGDRANLGIGDVILLAAAFEVPLGELFEGAGGVELAPGITLARLGVRELLHQGHTGEAIELGDSDAAQAAIASWPGDRVAVPVEADAALAKRLGVAVEAVVEAASRIWGRSLTEERDRRVAGLGDMEPDERQAHRGHITRELAREVEAAL